jgi:glucose/mannose-6-phosphate isomerase|tara:strand:- start:611 stop:1618 length:1008 start_codon:yes stop_codon:yes gene_type:complete
VDIATIEKYDLEKMYKIYDEWPKIAVNSFESKQETVDFRNVKHIVFAGMGGSGTIGDIFSSILSKSKIHVNVVKGYLLPTTVNSETVVIVVSVSGNTEESLSIIKSAYKKKCKIIGFSSGGELLEFCQKNKIEHRMITKYHSPRASFTSYLYTMLKVLYSSLEINQEDIFESIKELEKNCQKINSLNLNKDNPSLNLANWIDGIPIIYYPFGLEAVAIRFKSVLQENTKSHVMVEDIMESSHNGIMAWEKPSSVKPILLRGKDDSEKTKQRLDIFSEYFKKNNIEFEQITSIKGNIISKIVNLIYVLDYASIYLAIKREINPTPVNSISFIKSKL